ncbi:MAG: SMI1/KNR4 family protein [Lachnospiraceae bacterium]|nr:SMI1/KNR4 family protein [Lachnospiraceae bacterium]
MLISRFDNTNIDNYIQEFEGIIKRKLPRQYRNFLRKYNGGRTLETRFDIRG